MDLVVNPRGYKTIHIADHATGTTLCGRLSLAAAQSVAEDPEALRIYVNATTGTYIRTMADCTWCIRVKERGGQGKHRATQVCAECGEPWPCKEYPAENPDRCKATTASGRPCTKRAFLGGYCRIHDPR
jgi:hypothetical protein